MAAVESSRTVSRLRRIEGQVRGIARMIEEDRYCIDVLQQISAARAALAKVEGEVLQAHAARCVDDAIRSGDVSAQRKMFQELVGLFAGVRR